MLKKQKTLLCYGTHTIKEQNMKKINVKDNIKEKETKESSEVAKDLVEMKETLKKIEQLIALLVDILPYKR